MTRLCPIVFGLLLLLTSISEASAATGARASITDTSVQWPTSDQLVRVITLQDYNTRIVVIGTTLLGIASGIIGTFMLLRKRSLMGDAVSHATLPGIGIAFIVMVQMGGSGKYLPGLLLGALISGLLGMGLVMLIQNRTRIKEDAALGIVLSVFFGFGIAVLGVIQKMKTGHAAGLESFIYGKTASMLASDAMLIGIAALVVMVVCTSLFKEFTLLCFDQSFAGSQGWPVIKLDLIMMSLIVAITVIGLQAVGLILVIALLIIPSAAARFWTYRLSYMVVTAAGIGAASGLFGAGLSALVPRLPAGAIIVLVAGVIFLVSMLVGPARGVIPGWIQQWQLQRSVGRQHLLRAMYEWTEETEAMGGTETGPAMAWELLLRARSWSPRQLNRWIRLAQREALIVRFPNNTYRLTELGRTTANQMVRNHRLWELYLIHYADVAPSHVDRDADLIEHVLGPVMVQELEDLLARQLAHTRVPASPHRLAEQG